MTEANIRLGTDLITFYDAELWGLPANTSYEELMAAVAAEPKRYIEGMLDLSVEAGLDGIELAPPPVGWETAIEVYGGPDGLRAALADRGLQLASSYHVGGALIANALEDPSTIGAAKAELIRHAELLSALGCRTMVSGTVPRAPFSDGSFTADVPTDVFGRIAELVDTFGETVGRYGVTLALHTDAYSVCSRVDDVSRMMDLTSPDHVGLCIDAGHCTLDSSDPVEILRRHVTRTPVMHWKDCAAPLDGATLTGPFFDRHAEMLTYFRVLGSGIVDWPAWQEILREADWQGWAHAEVDLSPDPLGDIRSGIDYFRCTLAPIHE
ncbi:sugar phosphate isomerase/epimerase [Microbacterium sp. LMC-P-041]|uniref:sugar phosphate isomerase/epimerase family protein n=1 Tax=Microbacterium sp. LMC-P-041 TaxID=3040293 RepID=UPI00255479AE|nr:sugar phosphate isomerase/epimerase [Microbacterium sp. LMC-P-041]